MTDGQSEANEHIDTSHPALRQTPQERLLSDPVRWARLRKSARYGVPPWTVDDCRWVVWVLSGERGEQRKRCEVCDGTGEGTWFNAATMTHFGKSCERCNGTGYVETSE